MKIVVLFLCSLISSVAVKAMVYADSKVLSLEDMEAMGVKVVAQPFLGQKDKISVQISVYSIEDTAVYRSMEFVVLDKKIDSDFSSTDAKKSGIRDAKIWARELRQEDTEKKNFAFTVSPSELDRAYLVFLYDLPPRDGIPVFGRYYLLLTDIQSSLTRR